MEPFKFSDQSVGVQQMSELELMNTTGGGIGGLLITYALGMISPGHAFFYMGLRAGLRATD